MNEKNRKIRLYYSVAFSALTVSVGIFFILGAFRIFAVGGYAQGAYSRVAVGKTLAVLAFPFLIWVAGIIAAYVLALKFPLSPLRFTADRSAQLVKRLLPRVPADVETEYNAQLKVVMREEKSRAAAAIVSAVIFIACAVGGAVYIFDKNNFPAKNLNGEMLSMFLNVYPWLLVSILCSVGLIIFNSYSYKREITALKTLVASNKTRSATANPLYAYGLFRFTEKVKAGWAKFKKIMATDVAKWSVRGCVLVVAVTFVVLGINNGGMQAVLNKAIKICTECIGLG